MFSLCLLLLYSRPHASVSPGESVVTFTCKTTTKVLLWIYERTNQKFFNMHSSDGFETSDLRKDTDSLNDRKRGHFDEEGNAPWEFLVARLMQLVEGEKKEVVYWIRTSAA